MQRELKEEVSGLASPRIDLFGYINDDTNPVGEVHFGIVYLVRTLSKDIIPKDAEIQNEGFGFKKVSELEELCKSPEINVDNWVRILLGPLKYLLPRM